jgi:hypothetical protein
MSSFSSTQLDPDNIARLLEGDYTDEEWARIQNIWTRRPDSELRRRIKQLDLFIRWDKDGGWVKTFNQLKRKEAEMVLGARFATIVS